MGGYGGVDGRGMQEWGYLKEGNKEEMDSLPPVVVDNGTGVSGLLNTFLKSHL